MTTEIHYHTIHCEGHVLDEICPTPRYGLSNDAIDYIIAVGLCGKTHRLNYEDFQAAEEKYKELIKEN